MTLLFYCVLLKPLNYRFRIVEYTPQNAFLEKNVSITSSSVLNHSKYTKYCMSIVCLNPFFFMQYYDWSEVISRT